MFRDRSGLRNSEPPTQQKSAWLTAFCIAWGVLVAFLTLWPATEAADTARRINATAPLDFLANILLFAPIFAVIGARTTRWIAPLASAVLATFTIEALQILVPGRDPSIFDIIANFTGAALALCSTRLLRRVIPSAHGRAMLFLGAVSILATSTVICDIYASQYVSTKPPFFLQLQPRMNWIAQTEWQIVAHDFSGRNRPTEFCPPRTSRLRGDRAEVAK